MLLVAQQIARLGAAGSGLATCFHNDNQPPSRTQDPQLVPRTPLDRTSVLFGQAELCLPTDQAIRSPAVGVAKHDPFAAIFGDRRGPAHAPDEERKEWSIRMTFTIRRDEQAGLWTAAATEWPDDHGSLMNCSSPGSPEDAAAQLWEKMARRVRERSPRTEP